MEQSLIIINNISPVVAIILLGTYFCFFKSNDSIPCRTIRIGLEIILFALQIPRLVLEIVLNQPYGMTIFLLCLWLLAIACDSFLIGCKIGEASTVIEFLIEITDESSEQGQEENKETSDDD